MGKDSYVRDWDKFFDAAIDLLLADPFKTRVQLKYKNPTGIAVLKVTDDKRVVMHKCDYEEDLKKIETLMKASTQIFTNHEQQEGIPKKDIHNKKKSKKRA